MTTQILTYFILFIFSHYPVLIKSSGGFYTTDYELYGPTLAANNQFIFAIQNRTGISFSAVSNYIASPQYCSVTYTPTDYFEPFATMIAVGRNGLAPNNNGTFVFVVYSMTNGTTYLYIASINFNLCQLTILNETCMFNTTYPQYSVLGVSYSGTLAVYLSDQNIFIQSLISPYDTSSSSPIETWPTYLSLLPAGIDLKDTWGILGTYICQSPCSAGLQPYAYLVDFTNCFTFLNSSCFTFQQQPLLMNYYASWQTQLAPTLNDITSGYNSLYAMSVSINDINGVLIGVQSMNTIFSFTASSTSLRANGYQFLNPVPSVGFGKAVGWLDNTTAAVLLNNFTINYIQWRSSNIQLYSLTSSDYLSNTLPASVIFPNAHQQLWSQLNPRLINMIANPDSGSFIYMDYYGQVQVIRPSIPGYFVYTLEGIGAVNNTIYIAPTLQCPSGTIKNLSAYGINIFRYCLLCPEGSFYSLNGSNSKPNQCIPCNTTTDFCPWGSVAALPNSVLYVQSQTQVYPESPENDVFEDILLINMFNVDFPTYCLAKQPLFYAIIIIGLGCLVLLFMGILKLARKCKKQRRIIKRIFKQTDLIREGELWIGGVASFAIIVIAVFAYRFSAGFINQYPIETAGNATFACDPTLRNAQFSTSMQSLGVPVLEEEQPIFDMLDNQPFTLSVAFINTDFSANELTVSKELGTILQNLTSTIQTPNGILQASTNLTSHTTTIIFNVTSNSAVGGLRVGLSGPSMSNGNYYVQELNFSYPFNYSNRTTTQDPLITIQLIKLINMTLPLSNSDTNQYSALWIPTFIINDDQLFYTESDFQLYHVLNNTVLTVEITEATYYILNQQSPITKATEVIFTDILFTTMCIELFGLMFLFYKLAIASTIKTIRSLCTDPNKITPKGNGSGCPHCPHCQSIDPETLPANRLAIQRAEQDTPMYPIRRQTSDISKIHIISASPDMFNS